MIILDLILNYPLIFAIAQQRTLYRIDVLNREQGEQHMTEGCLVATTKTTVFQTESLVVLADQSWVNFLLFRVLGDLISVEKATCLLGM